MLNDKKGNKLIARGSAMQCTAHMPDKIMA